MKFSLIYLLRSAFSQYKWQIFLMGILSFLAGILEGVGVNAIIPLFALASNSAAEATDFISKAIKNFLLYFNFGYNVGYLLIFIAALFIFKALFSFVIQYIAVKITADYENKTRHELLRLTLESDWPYLSTHKLGYFDQILISNIRAGASLLAHISAAVFLTVNFLIYGLVVINISWPIAILSLAFFGITTLIFWPLVYKTRRVSADTVQRYKELAHYVNENNIGMKMIKAMSAEEKMLQVGNDYFNRIKQLQVKSDLLRAATSIFLQPAGVFFILAAFAFLYRSPDFNFASFAVLVYALNRIFTNIQAMQGEVNVFNITAPHLESVLNYKNEAWRHKELDSGGRPFVFNRHLEFRGVGFYYDGHENILSQANFSVGRGEMLGLIGPSGAGKTTVVDLLPRLFKPREGAIFLDGEDITNISLREWRLNVGYVSQDTFLINDTVLNNIRFFDNGISFEEVAAVAKMANIYDFIMSLPEQFETMVGERGLRLSGGQRQRIALARALARKPKILILDEATSALDNESEIHIQKAIEGLRGQITIIAIAHRLSTLLNFDKVVALEQGKIVEEGAPKALLQNPDSYFSKVYNLRQ